MTKEELRKSLDFVNEERERLQRENEDLRGAIADYQEAVGDYLEELERKDNIINGIEEYIRNYYDLLVKSPDIIEEGQLDILYEVLDKIKELENANK